MTQKRIRLRKCKPAFSYSGTFRYLILYDEASGNKDRYTVLVPTATEPVTVGRELDLKYIRQELIPLYETYAPLHWFGNRRPVLDMLRRVKASRQP